MDKIRLLKNVLIFTVGLGLGAFGSIMIVKQKYEDLYQDEVASVREVHDRACDKIGKPYHTRETAADSTQEEKTDKVLVLSKDRYQKIANRYNGEMPKVHSSEPDPTEHNYEAEEEEFERLSHETNNYSTDMTISIIDIDQFSNERDDFDKVTVYYYEDDDTLCDEDEEIIEDMVATIGQDAIDSFGYQTDTREVLYVRNEKLCIDYEIIRLSSSYKVQVLGNDPNEE